MELRRLRLFLAAAQHSSFRLAANDLDIAQSVLSRQIATLEDELGVDLFERRYTGARLTEAGHSFFADASRILADLERARVTVTSVAIGNGGRLRVALCEDATTPTFARILSAHRERCPGVVLDLFEMPSVMQSAALRRNEVDIGLLLPPVQAVGIQLDELWHEDWLVAMPSGHRLADMRTVPVSELAGENFITAHPEFGPGCHGQCQQMFLATGIQPRIIARAFRRVTMAMLVHSGAGVTLLPSSFDGLAMDGIELRPLLSGRHQMHVAAAYLEGDVQGVVAQFLRIASATAAIIPGLSHRKPAWQIANQGCPV